VGGWVWVGVSEFEMSHAKNVDVSQRYSEQEGIRKSFDQGPRKHFTFTLISSKVLVICSTAAFGVKEHFFPAYLFFVFDGDVNRATVGDTLLRISCQVTRCKIKVWAKEVCGTWC